MIEDRIGMEKYTADDLIIEAETLEETGEYLHMNLYGYSVEELRAIAKSKS